MKFRLIVLLSISATLFVGCLSTEAEEPPTKPVSSEIKPVQEDALAPAANDAKRSPRVRPDTSKRAITMPSAELQAPPKFQNAKDAQAYFKERERAEQQSADFFESAAKTFHASLREVPAREAHRIKPALEERAQEYRQRARIHRERAARYRQAMKAK